MSRLCRTPECTNQARPQRRLCNKCRGRLRRYGTVDGTSMTVVDEFEVELVVSERRPVTGLTRLEQRLAARQLTARGVSASEIGRIVAVSERTVMRWRADDRATARDLTAYSDLHARRAQRPNRKAA